MLHIWNTNKLIYVRIITALQGNKPIRIGLIRVKSEFKLKHNGVCVSGSLRVKK